MVGARRPGDMVAQGSLAQSQRAAAHCVFDSREEESLVAEAEAQPAVVVYCGFGAWGARLMI